MNLRVALQKSFAGFALNAAFATTSARLGIFGPSGSGKSTLVNLLAGLEEPDDGIIELDGETLYCAKRRINVPPERRRIAVVFQHAHLFPHMSVRRNLLYGYRRTPAARRRIDPGELIRVLDLEPLLARDATTLSGGERQRVALGRAVLASPRLLLMDEPLSALDEGLKYQIIPYLRKVFARFELPLLFISHSMNEMRLMTDEVVVLHRGEVELDPAGSMGSTGASNEHARGGYPGKNTATVRSTLRTRFQPLCSIPAPASPLYCSRKSGGCCFLLQAGKRAPDLGCGNGRHLAQLADRIAFGMGIDFSLPFIRYAAEQFKDRHNLHFALADLRALPVADGSFACAYSFAALYYLDDIEPVYAELWRVLAPTASHCSGRQCPLAGNPCLPALPSHCPAWSAHDRRAPGRPAPSGLYGDGLALLSGAADVGRSAVLAQLLRAPLARETDGSTIGWAHADQWICGLPGVRNLAFRHFLLCRRA